MNGVDPVASKYSSVTPYNYSFNDPVALNDPSGADPANYYFYGGYFTYDDWIPQRNLGWQTSLDRSGAGRREFGESLSSFGGGGWSLSWGGISIDYNVLPDGVYNFNFGANGELSSFGAYDFQVNSSRYGSTYHLNDQYGNSNNDLVHAMGYGSSQFVGLLTMSEVANDIKSADLPMGRFLSYVLDKEYGTNFFLTSIDDWTTTNSSNSLFPESIKFGLKTAAWGHNYFPDPNHGEIRHIIGAFLTAERYGASKAWDITSGNEYYGFMRHDLWPYLTQQERSNWAMEDKDFHANWIGIRLWMAYHEKK
jgi:hypothetical protein